MNLEENLVILNSRGIFLGPSELQEHFNRRAQLVKNDKELEALRLTQKIFDAFPDWVEVQDKAKGLLPWEGAVTWIEEDPEKGRKSSIQIRHHLSSLYSRTEVVAHEMVHAMRQMFDENRFEEILAFRTSQNRFRRYFGPLFNKPSETMCFVLVMVSSWVFCGIDVYFDFFRGAEYVLWSPLLVLLWSLVRLQRTQKIFSKTLSQLEKVLKKPEKSLAVALRLTDREIEIFSKSLPEEILSFVKKEKDESLRWRQIFAAYFN